MLTAPHCGWAKPNEGLRQTQPIGVPPSILEKATHGSTKGADMMDMMNNGNGAWMMSGMWVMSGLFWLLIIAGVVLLVRWLARRPDQGKTSLDDSLVDILKRRYANGEIDRETFEKMKQEMS